MRAPIRRPYKPNDLEPEQFKKPSWKRLAKKGIKINKAQYETK